MRKKIRTIAILPTLFTLGNLFCGFFSIVVASRIEAPGELIYRSFPPDWDHRSDASGV